MFSELKHQRLWQKSFKVPFPACNIRNSSSSTRTRSRWSRRCPIRRTSSRRFPQRTESKFCPKIFKRVMCVRDHCIVYTRTDLHTLSPIFWCIGQKRLFFNSIIQMICFDIYWQSLFDIHKQNIFTVIKCYMYSFLPKCEPWSAWLHPPKKMHFRIMLQLKRYCRRMTLWDFRQKGFLLEAWFAG